MQAAPDKKSAGTRVAVIGGGIIGVTSAIVLARDGYSVTLVEPGQPGGEQAASHGNAGWLNPNWVTPLSMPGLWKKVPGFLLDPKGPLTIDPKRLLTLAPWLTRFVRSGATEERVRRTSRTLASLLADCDRLHVDLAREAGVSHLIDDRGQIVIYENEAEFHREAFAWSLRSENGATWTEMDHAALRDLEPSLDPRYTFGVHIEGCNCLKPGDYTHALARHAQELGVKLVSARAEGFQFEWERLVGVLTDQGPLPCEKAVLSAGVRSKALAAMIGDRVLLEAERGYHVVFDGLSEVPANCALLADGRFSCTPFSSGIRVTGQAEFTAIDAPPDWRRAEVLREAAMRAYSGLWASSPPGNTRFWMGCRPSTSDSLPILGHASRSQDVVYAFGHGHAGLVSAPKTAEAVAKLVAGKPLDFDISAFGPDRFNGRI